MKNTLDYDRFLTETEKTTEGKAFVAFMSLIFWSNLTKYGKVSGEKNIGRMLELLSTIKRANYGEVLRF